jgi:hypothetical protein
MVGRRNCSNTETGWWFGTFGLFFQKQLGIIPTVTHSIIFQDGYCTTIQGMLFLIAGNIYEDPWFHTIIPIRETCRWNLQIFPSIL